MQGEYGQGIHRNGQKKADHDTLPEGGANPTDIEDVPHPFQNIGYEIGPSGRL